jgi:DNA repair protein RAD50
LKEQLKKMSPEALAINKDEEEEWSRELKRLQLLSPFDASRNRIKNVELPALERQIADQEAIVPGLTVEAEEVSRFSSLRRIAHLPIES